MVDSTRDLLIAGLKDAYAMERQSEDMLAIQSRRCGDYPQLKARLDQHADETKQQQRRLEECLNSFDESPSMIKDAAMRTVGNAANLFNMLAQDEVIKATLADYGFENFELASYKGLVALAEMTGDQKVAQACRQNLDEETAMAAWLDQHLTSIITEHARRTETGQVSRAGVV